MPLLVTENYGRGRTAVFATSGSWRWKMWQDHTDITHATFWQQLMRYLVSDSPGRVSASTPRAVLADETKVTLRAEVRDKAFKPVPNAVVEARIVGPDGACTSMELTPLPPRKALTRRIGTRRSPAPMWPKSWPGATRKNSAAMSWSSAARMGWRKTSTRRKIASCLKSWPRKPAGDITPPRMRANWRTRFRIRKPASQPVKPKICGTCLRSSCWRCCCAARSGCCAADGASYEPGSEPLDTAARLLRILLLPGRSALPATTYYVTVSGLGGEPDYEQHFAMWAKDIERALKPARDSKVDTLVNATREQVRAALDRIAQRS